MFIPVPTMVSEFRHRLDILSYKPLNLWSKAYLKLNMFHTENCLLNTVTVDEAILNDIKEWIPLGG